MDRAISQLKNLVDMGESITYRNVAILDFDSDTASLSADWIMWCTRSSAVVTQWFGNDSIYTQIINEALGENLIGRDRFTFESCRSKILGGLKSALDAAQHDSFEETSTLPPKAITTNDNKVFIVHGHDEVSKTSLEVLLREIGLEPIVLHRQPDEGQTIIEKFERHSDVGYAFILLTPDEISFLKKEQNLPAKKRNQEFRARPNVIFEFGFFVGKLGRSRVCCLHTGGVALPSDVSGLIYKHYSKNIEEIAYSIMKDLRACGFKLSQD